MIAHIRNAVNEALCEIDGKTHARVPNATTKAMSLNQQGIYNTILNGKNGTHCINHDDVINRMGNVLSRANESLLQPFKNFAFIFYATTRLGCKTFLTFKVEDIKKLMNGIAILSGEVMYNGELLNGDIHIDFTKQIVFYKERKSRYKYVLEADNRTAKKWSNLLEQLKMSLDNRI